VGETRAAAAGKLTAADYIEIQQLAVRYAYALDTGAKDGEMFADLFALDGAFVSATRGRIEGRDALVALGRGRGMSMYPRRFIVNHVIEPAADGATGKAYVIEVDLPSDGEKLGGQLSSMGGRYEVEIRKLVAGYAYGLDTGLTMRISIRICSRLERYCSGGRAAARTLPTWQGGNRTDRHTSGIS
jgi:SnoaL-like domain